MTFGANSEDCLFKDLWEEGRNYFRLINYRPGHFVVYYSHVLWQGVGSAIQTLLLIQYMATPHLSIPYMATRHQKSSEVLINKPANIYLLKVSNRNTKKRCEIFSKLTLKTPKRMASLTLTGKQSWLFPKVRTWQFDER